MKFLNGNSLIMKKINTNIVRNALKAERISTKQRLSELTGLSAVTVGSILQQLTSTHEVYEDELIPSNGGRPSHGFCYNSEYSHVLVIYAHEYHGQDKIYVCVANLIGDCIHKESTNAEDICLKSFEPIIDKLIEQYPTIKAIGFGLQAAEYNKTITFSDYKNLNGTCFTEHYRMRYSIPVSLENDVNLATIGYCHIHKIESTAAIIYIYFPQNYPPGAGIYINGSLYKGYNNFEGEIKHMPLDIDWDNTEYEDFDKTCDIVSKMVITITCMLNPEQFILYGNFLTEAHLQAITWNCKETLSETFVPKILLADDYDLDFQTGAIECALDLLKSKLSLSI